MTQIVHISNTNIEFEFAHPSLQSLELSLSRNPLCLQLQFLPLLYAQPEDLVAVTALPSENYLIALQQTGWWSQGLPQLVLLQDHTSFQRKRCFSWGLSRQVQAWAQARQMSYALPIGKLSSLSIVKLSAFATPICQKLPCCTVNKRCLIG